MKYIVKNKNREQQEVTRENLDSTFKIELQERKTLSNIRFDVKNLTTSLKAGFDKCKSKCLDMVRKIKI